MREIKIKYKHVSTNQLKKHVENWWDIWATDNFDPDPDSIPNDTVEIILVLEERGYSFNLSNGLWNYQKTSKESKQRNNRGIL